MGSWNWLNKIIIFCLFNFINSFLVLPFGTISLKKEEIFSEEFFNKIFYNNIYTNLTLGTPKQTFKSLFKMDLYGFVIFEGAYNRNNSTTYLTSNFYSNIKWLIRVKTTPSKELFYMLSFTSMNELKDNDFDKIKNKLSNIIKIKQVKFNYIEPIENKNSQYDFILDRDNLARYNKYFFNYGVIGLKLKTNPSLEYPELVSSLKELGEINSNIFSFKFIYNNKDFYNNDNNGYFILGVEPNVKDNIVFIQNWRINERENWNLYFEQIFSKANENEKSKSSNKIKEFHSKIRQAELLINEPYIIGTIEYKNYINVNFFREFIRKNICNFTKLNGTDFSIYKCNSHSKDFMDSLNNKFQNLVFVHNEFNERFILTKNDLFFKTNDYIYLLIIFPDFISEIYTAKWILGIPFFKKYQFYFDYRKKIIGYPIPSGKAPKNNFILDYFINSSIYFKIFIVVVYSIIIFLLGILFQRKFIKFPRKKKANELEEEYDYNSSNENNNKQITDYHKIKNDNDKDI